MRKIRIRDEKDEKYREGMRKIRIRDEKDRLRF